MDFGDDILRTFFAFWSISRSPETDHPDYTSHCDRGIFSRLGAQQQGNSVRKIWDELQPVEWRFVDQPRGTSSEYGVYNIRRSVTTAETT
jgi:hypothetical protein